MTDTIFKEFYAVPAIYIISALMELTFQLGRETWRLHGLGLIASYFPFQSNPIGLSEAVKELEA